MSPIGKKPGSKKGGSLKEIICACATAVALVACGGGGNASEPGAAPVPQSTPPVTFNFEATMSAALANGLRFNGLSTDAKPGTTLDFAYVPLASRTVAGVVFKRIRVSALARDNGLPIDGVGSSDVLEYTAPPVMFTSLTILDPLVIARMVYQSTGTLPTAATVGNSGPLNTGTNGTITVSTTWSLEASDNPLNAWGCIKTINMATQNTYQQECYKIDQAGTVSAAKITWPIGTQTLTFQ